jgi:hypothetical protein
MLRLVAETEAALLRAMDFRLDRRPVACVIPGADGLISPSLDQIGRRFSQSSNAGCPPRGRCGGFDLVKGAKDGQYLGPGQAMA